MLFEFLKKMALICFFLIFFPILIHGDTLPEPSTIHVVTPEWEGQTNKDKTGLFFEIIQNIYEPEGISIKITFVPWKRAQKMVANKKADAMLCVWKEEAEKFGYLLPVYPMYVEYTAVVFKNRTIKDWNGVKSLNGKSAVWLLGYNYDTFNFFKEITFNCKKEVSTYEKAWFLLSKNRYDVYIEALIDINKYIKKNQVDMTGFKTEILWGEKAYIAFAPAAESARFIKVYDRNIIKLFKSGKLKKIHQKWGAVFTPDVWSAGQ